MSAASGTSATRATVIGLPLSSASNSANSSRCSRNQVADARHQAPAAPTASSAATRRTQTPSWPRRRRGLCPRPRPRRPGPPPSSVAGLTTSKTLPDAAGVHWPPISIFLGSFRNPCANLSIVIASAVALIIFLLPLVVASGLLPRSRHVMAGVHRLHQRVRDQRQQQQERHQIHGAIIQTRRRVERARRRDFQQFGERHGLFLH